MYKSRFKENRKFNIFKIETKNGDVVLTKEGRMFIYEWVDAPQKVNSIVSNRLQSKTQLNNKQVDAWIESLLNIVNSI